MELQIADIATNERKLLKGFKVLGIFPFYLSYIKTRTHIKLCRIKASLRLRIGKIQFSTKDFYDAKLQENVLPYIEDYCVTALCNERPFTWFFRMVLKRKLRQCGHYHILNLYMTIQSLDQPAFFLTYWKLITMKENILLKEETPSSEE